MKKVYLVEVVGEFASATDYDLEYAMNNPNWRVFNTLTQARQYMVELKNKLKDQYKKELAVENEKDNTFSVDVQCYEVDDDFEHATYLENIWDYEHYLVDSRYLVGRY